MPTYLHKPVVTEAEVAALVEGGKDEDEQLDFKADMWIDHKHKKKDYTIVPAAEEFCSDIAAFQNHVGGDIVVGVVDRDSRAAGWYPADKARFLGKAHRLRDWMNQRLDPRDASANVTIWTCMVEKIHPVLVINVAPYAHGPVGVLCRAKGGSKRADRLYHLFPVRDGTATRYLEMAEVARRMDSRARANFLGAIKALRESVTTVRIASPVMVAGPRGNIPLHVHDGQPHAMLLGVDDQLIALKLMITDSAARLLHNENQRLLRLRADQNDADALKQLAPHTRGRRGPFSTNDSVEADAALRAVREVSVPLDLIRSLWQEKRGGRAEMNIALDAHLTWILDHWALVTR